MYESLEAIAILEWPILILMLLCGIAAFTLSTVSGGGGALVLIPVLNRVLGVQHTAPVLNLGTFLGRPARLAIFWKHIHWEVCWYYAPTAIVGAWIGSWLFSSIRMEWLQLVVGLFLVSTIFQFRFGKRKQSFIMQKEYFIPLGFLVSILSTMVGGMGPVLNPFYLNLGLDKEDLIATKTANSFFLGMSQVGSYAFFGLLQNQFWLFGIALGIGASIGSIIGKRLLGKMKSTTFRKLVIALMVISGLLLLFNQMRAFLM